MREKDRKKVETDRDLYVVEYGMVSSVCDL